MTKLIKIYRNKAVFLENGNNITVKNIAPNALKILEYYKNIKNF